MKTKLTTEEREKWEGTKRLIVDGWNAGLTGGELAATHGVTRNTIMGTLARARDKGAMVQARARGRHSTAATAARVKKAQERKPSRPEPSLPAITIQRPSLPAKTRQFPKPKPIIVLPRVIEPALAGLWVVFMDLQENAGCRYSEDAKLFCNRPGFPYCPDHKAIVNPASAQVSWKRRQKSAGRWL